jgi:hypothetical protein
MGAGFSENKALRKSFRTQTGKQEVTGGERKKCKEKLNSTFRRILLKRQNHGACDKKTMLNT